MSRLKSVPKAGWFVAGVAVAVLLIPTTVGAVAVLKFTGIEGTSTNKADVTADGQLLTTEANPSAYFNSGDMLITNADTSEFVYTPPAGQAAVVTSIHWDSWSLSGSDPFGFLQVRAGGCAPSNPVQLNFDEVDPAAYGVTVLPYSPGQVIPAGDDLCGTANSMFANVTAVGYTIPGATAPSLPLAAVAPQPHKP